MVPIKERRLIMFPGCHGRLPRAVEAAHFAKGLSGNGQAVKLFVEGVRVSEAKGVSLGLPFPVCPTAHDTLEKASAVMDAVTALHLINAFVWSESTQSPASLAFIKHCIGRYLVATYGDIPKTERLKLDARPVRHFLYDESIRTAKRLIRFGIDAGKIIHTDGEGSEQPIPPSLRRMSRELLAQMNLGKVDSTSSALLSQMTSYFKEAYNMPIETEGPAPLVAALDRLLEKETEPVAAAKCADGVSFYFFWMRKLFIAYRIAVEKFDNCVVCMDTARIERNIYPLFFRMGLTVEKK